MITVYPYEALGHADHGWLNARHHFSFAMYYNPDRTGFGTLKVINDDIIKAGAGFDTHSHRDMEIITYVRKGAITHRDSQGNEGKTLAGDVQVMNAGTGVFHSEYNLESEDTNIYQIWIEPRIKNVQPDWDSYQFPKNTEDDRLMLLVSGDGQAPLYINQDAYIYAGTLKEKKTLVHPIKHQAYVLVSRGHVMLDGQPMKQGDGAEIIDIDQVTIEALSDADILVIDVPSGE